MAKKSKSDKHPKRSDKEKTKKNRSLRRFFWRSFMLLAIVVVGALLIAPERVSHFVLTKVFEQQGLIPSDFEVTEASSTRIYIQGLTLGAGEFEAEEIRLTYNIPDVFLGRLTSIELDAPRLNVAMVSQHDAAGGTRPSFGVLDRYLAFDGPGGGSGFLSQTDIVITDGLILLAAEQTEALAARVNAELGADGHVRLAAEINQPDIDPSAFFARANLLIDTAGMIDAHATLDVTSFALFEWGLEDAQLDLTFQGRADDGEGVVRVDVAQGAVNPDIFAPLFAGDDNASLRDRLKDFSMHAELSLSRNENGFHATFRDPLQMLTLDESVQVTVRDVTEKMPALSTPSLAFDTLTTDIVLEQSGPALPQLVVTLIGAFEKSDERLIFAGRNETCSAITTDMLTIGNFVFEDASLDLCAVPDDPLFDLSFSEGALSNITHHSQWMSDALTLRYPRNAFSLGGVWPDTQINVVFEMATKDWRAELEGEGGDILMNENVARLDEIDTRLSVYGTGKQIQGVDGPLDHMRVQNTLDPIPLYAPLHVAGQMTSQSSISAFDGTVADDWGMPFASFKGEQNWSIYKGFLTFESGDLRFAIGQRQPQKLFPVLKDIMADATGLLVAKGEVDWRGERMTSQGTAVITDLDYASLLGPVQGINSTIVFGDLLPLSTKSPQLMTVEAIDIGLELFFGEALFSLGSDGQIIIEDATWPWAGGEIGIRRTPIALSDEPQDISLYVRDVQMEDVFLMLDVDGLSGTGVLSGDLPATLQPSGVLIRDGRFQSSQDGGVLQYTGPASEAGQQDESSSLMFSALKNFEYDSLDVTINGNTTDVLEVAIHLEGRNQEVLDGYPMKFNINTEGPLFDMIRRGTVGYRVPGKVQEQFE